MSRLLLYVAVKRTRANRGNDEWVPRRGGCTRVSFEKYGISFVAVCSPFCGNVAGTRSLRPPRKARARQNRFCTTISLREHNVDVTGKFERKRTHRWADLADGHLCTCGQGPGNSAAICRSKTASIRAGATSLEAPFDIPRLLTPDARILSIPFFFYIRFEKYFHRKTSFRWKKFEVSSMLKWKKFSFIFDRCQRDLASRSSLLLIIHLFGRGERKPCQPTRRRDEIDLGERKPECGEPRLGPVRRHLRWMTYAALAPHPLPDPLGALNDAAMRPLRTLHATFQVDFGSGRHWA